MSSPSVYLVRNEHDPEQSYHCDALASCFPDAREIQFPAGERFDPEAADAVVLSGSTAGVYEREREWIPELEDVVRELVDREVPTLGVCFGHQVANAALGGTVEAVGVTAGLVEATFADDPLFDGVSPIVVALHGDAVTERGEGMEAIAAAEHDPIFGTRHRSAPLWTVQFHPEITREHRERLVADFDWEEGEHSFDDIAGERLFENFRRLAGVEQASV